MDETPLSAEQNEHGIGPTLGIVVVVLLVAIGGIYFFIEESKRLHTPPVEEHLNA